MKRTTVNFIVDALALAALIILTATGALIRFVLPPGSGHTSALWGLDRHDWGHVHFWVAVVFCVAMVVHLVLHWGWVTCVVRGDARGRSKSRIALALIVVIALLVLAAAPFLGTVCETEEGRRGGRAGEHEGRAGEHEGRAGEHEGRAAEYDTPAGERDDEPALHEVGSEAIQGSMTLRDVQELTGVPVDHIIANLRLPVDVSLDERLGRLRRSHGFEMDDIRRIVVDYGRQGQLDASAGP